jgi:protein subunit release factor A
MQMLRSKLYQMELEAQLAAISSARKMQVRTLPMRAGGSRCAAAPNVWLQVGARAALGDTVVCSRRTDALARQVGTGSRSEKIRTYNYKDSRCTDHRLGSNFALDGVMSGEIEPLVQQCIALDQQERLQEMAAE